MKNSHRILQESRRILVAGATTDERLVTVSHELRALAPNARLLLLRPHREEPFPNNSSFDDFIQAAGPSLTPEDIDRAPACDILVPAIAHVTRPAYPGLIAACCRAARHTFVFTASGLQPVDERDARTTRPVPITGRRPPPGNPVASCAFFRLSDQPALQMAQQYAATGIQLFFVETLAALEETLPNVDTVYFDWCLTDYTALFQAIQLAAEAGKRLEAFVALDLADVTEDAALRDRLIELNRSALPLLDHAYILATRGFLAERYALSRDCYTLTKNSTDAAAWHLYDRTFAKRDVIRLAYHGLMYFWHELEECFPILFALHEKHPLHVDLFGRPHENLCIGGASLFPEREEKTRRFLRELEKLPFVQRHGFIPQGTMIRMINQADYYIGITAGATLMSRSEMRTGVVEAMHTRTRVLHKTTDGTLDAGWRAGIDYLEIDAADPARAADRILEDFRART